MNCKIGAVLVTYNRIEKLKIALESFDLQRKKPAYIIIVDNASTDGTGEFLDVWKHISCEYEKIVITLPQNTGGSGGFYEGLRKALTMSAEWIWVSDDDAFPESDAIGIIDDFISTRIEDVEKVSAVCGAVINYGEVDIAHRKNMHAKGVIVCSEYIPAKEYEKLYFELNCFSYVGSVINKSKLQEVGLPCKDYFLWWDDTEHSLRLSKVGKIYCVPAARIHHDVTNGTGEFTWKTYYGFRNMTDLYRRHFPYYCYIWYCSKLLCKTYLKDIMGKDREQNKAIRCALKDSKHRRFGLHSVYKPGWKPNE